METLTATIKDRLNQVFTENFGLEVKAEGIDPEVATYVRINTQQILMEQELKNVLDIKSENGFDEVKIKRSGAGLKIEFILL